MKLKKLLFTLVISIFYISFSSCSDDNDTINDDFNISIDKTANIEFARGLALAIKNKEIRNFIKEEALKEIDKDYDVIYALVKNRKLENGETFREALAKHMGGIDRLDSISQLDRTLTILVPFLGDIFSPESWDIENTTPIIAYRDQMINKRQQNLLAFDSQGNSFYLPRYEIPERPTLVVKSNERLSDLQSAYIKATNKASELYNDDGELIAYYINEEFVNNNSTLKTITTVVNKVIVHDNVTPFFESNVYYQSLIKTPESPRDYIYYGISLQDSINKGQLNTNYKEFITSLKFNNKETLSHVEDRSDASADADWSDGNLEITFDFLFLTKEEVLSKVNKMISVKITDLFTSNGTKTYDIPNPIEVFNWDMYKYGNTFKVIVSEYDPGNLTEMNNSISTTFGNNWEIGTSGGFGAIWKVNAKYSGSYTEQKQSSTKINSTNNSDPLGEVLVDFFNPVLLKKKNLITATIKKRNGPDPAPRSQYFDIDRPDLIKLWMDNVVNSFSSSTFRHYIYFNLEENTFYKSNTGMVSLSIVPMKIN